MPVIINKWIAYTLLTLSLGLNAQAQVHEQPVATAEPLQAEPDRNDAPNFGFFGTAEFGSVRTSPTGNLYPKLEINQSGSAPAVKLIGTTYTRKFVFDLGIGIQSATYSGERIGKIEVMNDENGQEYEIPQPIRERYSITQTAMLLEAAARLKIKQKFQIGIRGNALIAKENTDFSSLLNSENTNKNRLLILAGPQFVYEAPMMEYLSRISANFAVSLNGKSRAIYLATVSAGLGNQFSNTNPNDAVLKTDSQNTTSIEKSAGERENKHNIFIFQIENVRFKENLSELTEESAQLIADFAKLITQDKGNWEKIIVEGRDFSPIEDEQSKNLSSLRLTSITNEMNKLDVNAEQLLINELSSALSAERLLKFEVRLQSSKEGKEIANSLHKIKDLLSPKTNMDVPEQKNQTSNPDQEKNTVDSQSIKGTEKSAPKNLTKKPKNKSKKSKK